MREQARLSGTSGSRERRPRERFGAGPGRPGDFETFGVCTRVLEDRRPREQLTDGARLFEVNLFDVDENLYGKKMRVEIVRRLRGEKRTFPAYALGERVIWGMTERILTPFLDLVAPTAPPA